MALIIRGSRDALMLRVKRVLGAYERKNPGSMASLFRVNSGAIWVRVVSEAFRDMAVDVRHARVAKFLRDQLPGDDVEEVSALILLTHAEQNDSFMNRQFNDPVPVGS